MSEAGLVNHSTLLFGGLGAVGHFQSGVRSGNLGLRASRSKPPRAIDSRGVVSRLGVRLMARLVGGETSKGLHSGGQIQMSGIWGDDRGGKF